MSAFVGRETTLFRESFICMYILGFMGSWSMAVDFCTVVARIRTQ